MYVRPKLVGLHRHTHACSVVGGFPTMSTSEKLGFYTYVIGMIIGVYRDGQQPGNCRAKVEAMRDYLKNSGY